MIALRAVILCLHLEVVSCCVQLCLSKDAFIFYTLYDQSISICSLSLYTLYMQQLYSHPLGQGTGPKTSTNQHTHLTHSSHMHLQPLALMSHNTPLHQDKQKIYGFPLLRLLRSLRPELHQCKHQRIPTNCKDDRDSRVPPSVKVVVDI